MIDALDRAVAVLARLAIALAALALLASLALVGYSVVMRYFVNIPVPWIDEIVGYLLVFSVMLASADALREGEHISVDVLTERLGERGRWLALLFGLAAVAASAALLIYGGLDMVSFSRMSGLRSNSSLAVPMWLPQLAVPVGAALLLAAACTAFAAALRDRRAPPPHEMPPPGIE